jgi:hypothetical protein
MTKDDILGALPNLNRADLETVHAMAGSLLGGRLGNVAVEATPQAQIIFDALTGAIGSTMAYKALPTAQARAFNKRVVQLNHFLTDEVGLWKENRITQLAFLRMMFGLIVSDLTTRLVPVQTSMGIMIMHIGRIPVLFDQAFPGYRQSNMMGLVLSKFRSEHEG